MEIKEVLKLNVTSTIGNLTWNFKEINNSVDNIVKKYNGLQITADQVADAKDARAKLNNLAKAINKRKIEEKKTFCAPYMEFEKQVKETIGKINSASDNLDVQVKKFEKAEEEKKIKEINEMWKSFDLGFIPIENVWNPKWLNKSYTFKKIKDEMVESSGQYQSQLDSIRQMDEVKREFVEEEFKRTCNLTDAMLAYDRMQAQIARQQEIEEQKRLQEEQKRLQEQQRQEQIQEQAPKKETFEEMVARQRFDAESTMAPTPKQVEEEKQTKPQLSDVYEITFRATATVEEFRWLSAQMNDKGIKFAPLARRKLEEGEY